MHLSACALLRNHRGEGPVCSLSHQKGLASLRANTSLQSQPYGRKLWVGLLAYGGVSWGFGRACCDHTSAPFTTVTLLSRVQTQSGDRCFRGARYCRFLVSRAKQPQTARGTKEKWKAPLRCFAFSHVKSSSRYIKQKLAFVIYLWSTCLQRCKIIKNIYTCS